MDDNPAAPKASRSVLYIILAAAGGIALGLAIGLLAGGSGTVTADPSAVVVETGGEESVITPEAAEAAGYMPVPTYRVIAKEDADKLAEGMTAPEVQTLFPEQPIIYETPSVQPPGNSYRTGQLAVIGLSPDGQITLAFADGRLSWWGWQQGMTDSLFGTGANDIIKAVQEGAEGEWASTQHQW